jgi:thioredoxin 1
MNKYILSLILILSFFMACSQNSNEGANIPQEDPEAAAENDLIVTAETLDFSKHKVTFIEVGADKCIPCKAMQPIMREIAKEYEGKIQVVFYDVWKFPVYAQKYGVQVIPTQIFFNPGGQEIFRHTGIFPKEDIIAMLKEKQIL